MPTCALKEPKNDIQEDTGQEWEQEAARYGKLSYMVAILSAINRYF